MDNPVMFLLALSIGLIVGGTLVLLASLPFPHTDRNHPYLFVTGLALAQAGFTCLLAGVLLLMVWVFAVVVVIMLAVL